MAYSMFVQKSFFIVCCALFRVVLDVSYFTFLNPVFEYSGFPLEFHGLSYSFSWLVIFVCILLTPQALCKVSDYFMVSFLLTILLPLSSLIGLGGFDFYPFILSALVFLLFRAFQYGSVLSKLMVVPKLRYVKEGRVLSMLLAIVSVIVLIFWYIYSGSYRFFNLDFSKVYEFRSLSSSVINVGLWAYLGTWVFSVFSIFLMCVSLHREKYIIFILLVLVQVFFYGITSQKSVFFYPILIFGIWFYFRKTSSLLVIPLAFSAIVSISLFLFLVFDHVLLGSMFIRRVFFVPAYLTVEYVEFFSLNQHIYWSNSLLSRFIEYPYDLPLPKLIGAYIGNDSSANNGFLASGFAHAGLFGVLIYTFIFSYFLKILDLLVMKSDLPVWLGLAITIIPLRNALISSDLFTTMLTHGLALSLVVVILFRKSNRPTQDYG